MFKILTNEYVNHCSNIKVYKILYLGRVKDLQISVQLQKTSRILLTLLKEYFTKCKLK
jgi:hypothetical protein